MPAGPVYQPTTYERPSSLSPSAMLRRPMPQICVLILALMSIAAGK